MIKLDKSKISKRVVDRKTSQEILNNTPPMYWSDDVILGKSNVKINSIKEKDLNGCVKLEISYS